MSVIVSDYNSNETLKFDCYPNPDWNSFNHNLSETNQNFVYDKVLKRT